jgi:hypothetical protein
VEGRHSALLVGREGGEALKLRDEVGSEKLIDIRHAGGLSKHHRWDWGLSGRGGQGMVVSRQMRGRASRGGRKRRVKCVT